MILELTESMFVLCKSCFTEQAPEAGGCTKRHRGDRRNRGNRDNRGNRRHRGNRGHREHRGHWGDRETADQSLK